MSDALISTPVAVVADVAALALLAVAGTRLRRDPRPGIVPLMGVMGAFVFAAQMVNFAVPGTGSSGHVVGGVFLAAVLGPWASFVTLASVLIIQCLVFADGGLLALGGNIIDMGVTTCLIAWPLIFKPLVHYPAKPWKVMLASVLACTAGLELGAALSTLQIELSGVTALSGSAFLGLMCGIHLPIGVVEGLATGALICFVQRVRPDLLHDDNAEVDLSRHGRTVWSAVGAFGIVALILGGILSAFASGLPDGLEWSMSKVLGGEELPPAATDEIQESLAAMPGYDSSLSGVVGVLIVLAVLWCVTSLLRRRHDREEPTQPEE